MVAIAAETRREGLGVLRSAGADVSELVARRRAGLNLGRAPRTKAAKGARLLTAVEPAATRLAPGNPSMAPGEMHLAPRTFAEACARGTQAADRVSCVASDEAGRPKLADRI